MLEKSVRDSSKCELTNIGFDFLNNNARFTEIPYCVKLNEVKINKLVYGTRRGVLQKC